ncbi:WD repeat-containing protein 93 isoform X2 [Scomber scombrus]
MEDINQRSICLTFELSKGGNYGAASISCNGAVWLDVYHFPTEAWRKELEMAVSQQDPNLSGDVKWSPAALVIKTRPPKTPADGSLEVLQTADILTHCLALDGHTSSHHQEEEQSYNTDAEKAKETNDHPRRCTQHFLLPCGQFPSNSKAKSGLPVSVCVWWSGSHNLLHYCLHKVPKNKPDMEPLPDVLCPNANEIVCSAVSRCTCFIALGLSNALVCVWDRHSGSPLSVVSMLAAESVFSRLHFVDYWPLSADDSQTFTTVEIHLMVVCKNGVIHTVTTGRGTESCTMQLTERPEDSGDLPTITASVSFLQGLHALFIRGDQEPSCSAFANGQCQSQLFIFHFGKPDIMKQYNVSLPDSPQQQNALNFDTLDDSCNLYLQQRALSVDERNKTLTQTWKKLQETAEMLQQRHGS